MNEKKKRYGNINIVHKINNNNIYGQPVADFNIYTQTSIIQYNRNNYLYNNGRFGELLKR